MAKKKKIQFSLVYRDMFQSSGKFQPRKDQLARIAPVIIEMGCFSRVETNGGAFEQVNLLAGENPNEAVRTFCKPFNEAGILTHMLDRGLNALRMYPVPDDVRKLMYKVKKKQGTDITRIFCGLNDVRNIIPSIQYAKEGGMIPQATLCITNSPIHTAEYYSRIADQLIEAGAPEICLKDMAGIGQPAMLGRLTAMIKKNHPDCKIAVVGPCAAKKLEASRRSVKSYVDFVLTFEEVAGMFNAKEIFFADLPEDKPLREASGDGRGFAASGGVAKAVVNYIKKLDPSRDVKVVSAEGLDNCKKMLMLAKAGKYNGYLLEGMACPGGCIAGAGTLRPINKAAQALAESQKAADFAQAADTTYADWIPDLEKFDKSEKMMEE